MENSVSALKGAARTMQLRKTDGFSGSLMEIGTAPQCHFRTDQIDGRRVS